MLAWHQMTDTKDENSMNLAFANEPEDLGQDLHQYQLVDYILRVQVDHRVEEHQSCQCQLGTERVKRLSNPVNS